MSKARSEGIFDLVCEAGRVRPRDLESVGGSGRLPRAAGAKRGLLAGLGRGLYAVPGAVPSEHRLVARVSERTPLGVTWLLSAMRFDGCATQAPPDVWLAIGRNDRAPRLDGVPRGRCTSRGCRATRRLGEVERSQAAEALRSILAFRAIRVVDAALLHRTVELYEVERLDFADAYLVATAERTGVGVVASFDRGIDRVGTIRREEPS